MTQSNRKFHTLAMLIGTTTLENIVWQDLAKVESIYHTTQEFYF